MPDISTLRLSSLLLNLAFTAVFLGLWRGRKEEGYLLHWAVSAAIYAGALITFDSFSDGVPPLLDSALMASLIASNLLLLTGIRLFDGQPAFRPWMLLPPLLGLLAWAMPLGTAALGIDLSLQAARRTGGTLALLIGVILIGMVMLHSPAGDAARRGRRIAAFALMAYAPGYLVAIALEVHLLAPVNFAAMLPMVSDQVLLAILYLGLLSMPGERAHLTLRDAALRDPLTGAWNRAGLDAQLRAMTAQGGALILLDIDHFKSINDRHGHAAGDAVLSSFAAHMAALASEKAGLLARIGGDEFVVLLPRATAGEASTLAQQMRRAAAAAPGVAPYTISMGLATVATGETTLADAMARADDRLYQAKAQGRDRVVV